MHSTRKSGGKPAESAHYAWAKDVASRRAEVAKLGVDHSPKPVSGAQEAPQSTVALAGASPWNAAGTWEERDVSERAGVTLESTLLAFSRPVPGGLTLRVTRVHERAGSASVAFVRGKVRPGYDFPTVRLSWQLDAAAGESSDESESAARGSIELIEVRPVTCAAWLPGSPVAPCRVPRSHGIATLPCSPDFGLRVRRVLTYEGSC